MATNIEDSKPNKRQEIEQQTEQVNRQIIHQEQEEPVIASTQILLDNVYESLASAEWRIKVLNEIDIDAKIGYVEDFELDFEIDKDYFVFLEDTKDGLRQVSNDYRKKLFDADLKVIDAEIVTILEQKNDK